MSRSLLSRFAARLPRAVAEHFPYANRCFASRQENDLDSDIESEFRRKPEFTLAEGAARVLDGCSQRRNQRPHQNFLTN
jgi:hypothetical protein